MKLFSDLLNKILNHVTREERMLLALHHQLKDIVKIMALQQADIAAAATSIDALGPLITAAVAAAAADNTLDLTPVTTAVANVKAQLDALVAPAPTPVTA